MTFLLECSLRITVVLAMALLVIAMLRRRSAALRHCVMAGAMLCAAVVPLLTLATPGWKFEVPIGPEDMRVIRSLGHGSVRRAAQAIKRRHFEIGRILQLKSEIRDIRLDTSSQASSPVQLEISDFGFELQDSSDFEISSRRSAGSVKYVDALTEEGTRPPDPTRAPDPTRLPEPADRISVIKAVWVSGATLILTVLLTGWVRLAWIAWHAAPMVNQEWTRNVEHIVRDYRLRRRIHLLQSQLPGMLATWGLLRPKVVLPRDAENWDEERIQVVLRHELAHVRRLDWMLQTLAELMRVVYWFNPLIWIGCARLRRESEQACDDTVLNSGVAGSEYAAHLLDLARTFRGPRHAWSPALLMARESTLEQRFKALLNPTLNRRALTRLAIAATLVLFSGVTLPIAALRVSAQELLSLELPANVLAAPFAQLMNAVRPQQSDSASIDGVVVRLGTGEPLSEVHVELNTQGLPLVSRSAATDIGGRFTFQSIPPGEYHLVASLAGGYLPAEYGQRSPNTAGLPIKLAPNQKMADVRLTMAQSGSIAGRVADRDGEPVGRAQVQALMMTYVDGRRVEMIAASAPTDDRGEYRLFWLRPGQYRISATPQDVRRGWSPVIVNSPEHGGAFTLLSPAFVTRRVLETGEVQEEVQVPVYFPGTTDIDSAALVDVSAGANVSAIDITVVPPARTRRIRGSIIDAETGQPAANASVTPWPLYSGGSVTAPRAKTDRNGWFEISGLVPGSYLLTASAPAEGNPFGVAGSLRGSTPITVGSVDVDNVSVVLSSGFNIPVKVTLEGRATDGGLGIRLTRVPDTMMGSEMAVRPGTPQRNLLTTPQFTMEGLDAGDYRIRFFSMGDGGPGAPLRVYVKSMRMGGADVSNGMLHLDGRAQGPLEIVISANSGALEGSVFSDKREPAANVRVALVPDAPYRGRADLYKNVTTDAAGRFQIAGIAPGNYRVFAWEEVEFSAWQDPEFIRLYEGRGKPIHFAEGDRENAQLTLIPAGR